MSFVLKLHTWHHNYINQRLTIIEKWGTGPRYIETSVVFQSESMIKFNDLSRI